MSRLAFILAILVLILAACSPAVAQPTQPVGSDLPPSQSAPPSAEPSGPADVPSTPVVTPRPTPTPAPVKLTADEKRLIAGIRRGATGCRPVRGADLPARAIAGVDCASTEPAVARMGFYLFENDEAILDTYFARIRAAGLEKDSGACRDGEGESQYVPGDEEVAYRHACFVNDEGYANYRAILAGGLYIGLLGRTDDPRQLEDFAWRGNQDIPGAPTLWADPRS